MQVRKKILRKDKVIKFEFAHNSGIKTKIYMLLHICNKTVCN